MLALTTDVPYIDKGQCILQVTGLKRQVDMLEAQVRAMKAVQQANTRLHQELDALTEQVCSSSWQHTFALLMCIGQLWLAPGLCTTCDIMPPTHYKHSAMIQEYFKLAWNSRSLKT